jgi:hypothetical protein
MLDDLRLCLSRRYSPIKLIDAVQTWAGENGREAMLSADTWNSYRDNAGIEAHLPTVLILAEFFNSQPVKPGKAASRFHDKSSAVLRAGRAQRFQRSVGQDPLLRKEDVDRRAGAYVVFRVESEHGNPCQELVLVHPAAGKARARFATIIGRNLIVRGHWHLLGNSLYVAGLGFRAGHLPDFLTLSFLESDEIAGGVISGLGTSRREPVTMSVVVMKLPDINYNLGNIGDQSDAVLIKEFRAAVPRMMTKRQKVFFDQVQKEVYGDDLARREQWLAQKLITSADPFVACLRSRDMKDIIDPGLRRFCANFG